MDQTYASISSHDQVPIHTHAQSGGSGNEGEVADWSGRGQSASSQLRNERSKEPDVLRHVPQVGAGHRLNTIAAPAFEWDWGTCSDSGILSRKLTQYFFPSCHLPYVKNQSLMGRSCLAG